MLLKMCKVGNLKGVQYLFLNTVMYNRRVNECVETAFKNGHLEIVMYFYNTRNSLTDKQSNFLIACNCVK